MTTWIEQRVAALEQRLADLAKQVRSLTSTELVLSGNGDPNGVVTAVQGTHYWDITNQVEYINTSVAGTPPEGTDWCDLCCGTAWVKITADSVTITVGGKDATSIVANLQTACDGLFFHVDEVAAAPAINVIVDFVNVVDFNWVQILAIYDGSSTHAVALQLYNWVAGTWDTFNAAQTSQEDVATANGYIMDNYSFVVPTPTPYIGTGGNAGQVRVRFYHTMMGNTSHDLYIDVVALYV